MYSYDEFTIEVRRGQEGTHGHRVTVQATRPDGGETGSTDAEPTTTSVARLLPAESAPQRAGLGNVLGECLFPPRVLEAFQRTLSRLSQDTGVRVRLRCLDEEMERWPWELARIETPFQDDSRYLFRNTRFSLVRVPVSAEPVYQPKDRRNLVILTVDATEVVQGRKLIPDFPAELDITGPVRFNLPRPTPRSIDEQIDRIVGGEDPLDIFHFTGHGRAPGGGLPGALVVYRDDEDTAAQYYPGDVLAERLGRAGTSLAFVNACYTDQPEAGGAPGIAQALTGVVPVVLAVRGAVGDWVARDFAAVFYHWLLRGSTVDEAVARGRRRLDESLNDWDRVVLYSRAHRGRFLEPATPADAQVLARTPASPPVRGPAADGIRRWAVVAGAGGHWQLVPGEAGSELRRVDAEMAADISHLRRIAASLALSSDARVVAQLNRGQLTLAWVDRVGLRLDPWPAPVHLPLDDQETRLLAVAVDYGDEVICVLSSDQVTYQAEVSPAGEPAVTKLFDTPTRCAAIVAGTILTVDGEGRLRDRMLNLSSRGIAEVSSLDAARSAGRVSYVLAGLDDAGRPVVAEGSSIEALSVMAAQADEVAVIRPLSRAHAPDQALLALGGQLERLPVGDAP